jgi:hypothetical protein
MVAVDVDNQQAELIFNLCKDLAPDLGIGMRIAGDHHDIGIDLTGKREAAKDLKHPRRRPHGDGFLRSSR